MKHLFLILITFLMVTSCSNDSDDDTIVPPAQNNAIQLKTNATFGNILTTSDGFTLYFFSKDSKAVSNCIGGCLSNWPAFFAENLTLDNGLNASDFGTITRADGSKQTTFKGWPLYTFTNDASAGSINGDGAGEVWYVAKPDYTVMVVSAQLVGRDKDGNETNLTSNYTEGDEETFYMVDAEGNTLYSFINDTNGVNSFTKDDFSNNGVWPIFETTLAGIPSILNASDFGSIGVFGRSQITYKGWPLYFFGQDTQRGDNYGVGFPVAGVWPIVNQNIDEAPTAQAPSAITYTIGNQGASAYLFSGEGLNNTSNPDITLKRGETYEFVIDAPGHPFLIKTAQTTGTGDGFNDGVTNNGASQGTVTFTVPANAPDTLFYICQHHASMKGTFNIVD
ncbi:hypothetical protein [Hyunsoonleella pacifica]|uniref:Uncharacterized protein n=1 Tax=Hyunsoonleella pacifica TaxID=1080224 RepID=A0A4Q9FT32_9FLAO|nr:hypothetical protein [Hyunsoonleella pacifica]TBN18860.1 hypothetical protein EYD46_01990 [Hyunsoonleella pacifica]GGD05392.1 hypothetical protein GCM10011368_03980 [Hyunsoonleella pacifica]